MPAPECRHEDQAHQGAREAASNGAKPATRLARRLALGYFIDVNPDPATMWVESRSPLSVIGVGLREEFGAEIGGVKG